MVVSVITILLLVEIAVQFEYVTSINPMHSNGRFVTFSRKLLLLEGVRNGNEGWGTRSKKKNWTPNEKLQKDVEFDKMLNPSLT